MGNCQKGGDQRDRIDDDEERTACEQNVFSNNSRGTIMAASQSDNGTGRQNGVFHPVDDFLVGWANRGQHAAEMRPGRVGFTVDKVVRTETDAAFHLNQFMTREIEPVRFHQLRPLVSLQDKRCPVEMLYRQVNRCRPVRRGQVAAEINARARRF
jgi:hypothetical protein